MTTPRQKAAKAEQSFDLDQARAIRRDREGAEFKFTFGGDSYSCLPIKEWGLATSELLAAGEMAKGLRIVLGDQWDSFESHDPGLGDIQELIEALGKFGGVGDSLGE